MGTWFQAGTYKVDMDIGVTGDGEPNELLTVFIGEVSHRYGVGAWALVSKVIAAAGLDQAGGADRLRAAALSRRDTAEGVC